VKPANVLCAFNVLDPGITTATLGEARDRFLSFQSALRDGDSIFCAKIKPSKEKNPYLLLMVNAFILSFRFILNFKGF
jgi:hypothetical protein